MAGPAGGRRSSHGIDRASTGSRCGERWSGTGSQRASSGRGPARCAARCICAKPSPTTAAWAKERFRRRRTDDQATGGARTGFELRAGCGTATLANGDTAEAPVTRAEVVYKNNWRVCWSRRTSSCRVLYRIFWAQCAAHVARPWRTGKPTQPRCGAGRLPTTGDAGTIARRAGRLHGTESNFPSASADGVDELQLIETHIEKLEREAMQPNEGTSGLLCNAWGSARIRVDSALQMIAEVGWGCVRGMEEAQESRTAHARRRATTHAAPC